jgi:hypothetical protein
MQCRAEVRSGLVIFRRSLHLAVWQPEGFSYNMEIVLIKIAEKNSLDWNIEKTVYVSCSIKRGSLKNDAHQTM